VEVCRRALKNKGPRIEVPEAKKPPEKKVYVNVFHKNYIFSPEVHSRLF
jgi:hypothetical protein